MYTCFIVFSLLWYSPCPFRYCIVAKITPRGEGLHFQIPLKPPFIWPNLQRCGTFLLLPLISEVINDVSAHLDQFKGLCQEILSIFIFFFFKQLNLGKQAKPDKGTMAWDFWPFVLLQTTLHVLYILYIHTVLYYITPWKQTRRTLFTQWCPAQRSVLRQQCPGQRLEDYICLGHHCIKTECCPGH